MASDTSILIVPHPISMDEIRGKVEILDSTMEPASSNSYRSNRRRGPSSVNIVSLPTPLSFPPVEIKNVPESVSLPNVPINLPPVAASSSESFKRNTASKNPSIMKRLTTASLKEYNADAYQEATEHVKRSIDDPIPKMKKKLIKTATGSACMVGAILLITIFIIVLIVMISLVAANVINWLTALIAIILTMIVIILAVFSMKSHLSDYLENSTDEVQRDFNVWVNETKKKLPDVMGGAIDIYNERISKKK